MEEKENRHAQPLDQRKNEGKEKESLDRLLIRSSDWQNLSTDLLQSILDRISSFSIPDLLSFSSVCTSWRSLAKSSPKPISRPPLLLSPSTNDPCSNRSSVSLLNVLTPNQDPRTYGSLVPKRALNRNCCGCSYGHLIFASSAKSNVLVADLFSSAKFRLPNPPRGSGRFTHGVLTAPPSSSSSMLILVNADRVLCWRLWGDPRRDEWLVIRRPRAADYAKYIDSVTLLNETLHIMYTDGRIFALEELIPPVQWKRLPDAPCGDAAVYTRLAECNGELLIICFMESDHGYIIEAYRMDFHGSNWVRVESIGDCCLFVDYVGRCPLACRDPRKWGGESNCIYFARTKSEPQSASASWSWSVFPMDGTEFQLWHEFKPSCKDLWPSSAWVYPSDYEKDARLKLEALMSPNSSWESADFTEIDDTEESACFSETDESGTEGEGEYFSENESGTEGEGEDFNETDESGMEGEDFNETDESGKEDEDFNETDESETDGEGEDLNEADVSATEESETEGEGEDFNETDESETEGEGEDFSELDESETEGEDMDD